MIDAALYFYLRTHAALTPIIGSGTVRRVFPIVIPQRDPKATPEVPALVYAFSGVARGVSYCGTDRLARSSVTIDCYATRYHDARALASAVRSALLDFRGAMGDASQSPTVTVNVRTANITTEFDLLDIEPGLYRVSQSWEIWHEE